eukprot:3662585-Amphidinium_carterae.1
MEYPEILSTDSWFACSPATCSVSMSTRASWDIAGNNHLWGSRLRLQWMVPPAPICAPHVAVSKLQQVAWGGQGDLL